MKNKNLLKNRYKIEFTNNRLDRENKKIQNFFIFSIVGKYASAYFPTKQYKRINIRYDKFGVNYLNYVYLAAIDLIAKN